MKVIQAAQKAVDGRWRPVMGNAVAAVCCCRERAGKARWSLSVKLLGDYSSSRLGRVAPRPCFY